MTEVFLHVKSLGPCRAGLPGKYCKAACPLQQNGYDCGMYVLGARPEISALLSRGRSLNTYQCLGRSHVARAYGSAAHTRIPQRLGEHIVVFLHNARYIL